MNFTQYQEQARQTAIYPDVGNNLWYPTLGLAGESGEVAEKVKKVYRDDNGNLTLEKKLELVKELGDVLWYVSNIASEIKYNLDTIARFNLDKLNKRVTDNVVHGSGDNR